MKKVTLLAILYTLLSLQFAFSQGSIKGKIIDSKTGETVPGASVLIEGTTTGSSTDFDGKFSINNLQEGSYNIVIKFISYNTKIINGIQVKNGQPTIIDATIDEASTALGEVVVTATMNKESVNALLVMQKNNASVSDGVSSESIKRTPDKNTGDVIKRVSGASIQDNKFAIIRGLNDRYNAAFINGATLPSSESDRKAFSFDIFPSNLLDNLVIVKTATPELPGDFAGGVIQINTKSIPDENIQSISIGCGYNTITTFNKQVTYTGGKTDWIGIDDGKRGFNSELPATKDFLTYDPHQKTAVAKLMANDWALHNKTFLPNFNFQYALARTIKLKKEESDLGLIFALTHNKSNSYNESVRREFLESASGGKPEQEFELNDTNHIENALSGILANVSYKINNNNTLSIKNVYSVNSEDRVVLRNGIREYYNTIQTLEKSSLRWFTENKLYSGQLNGKHLFAKNIKLNWLASYGNINRNIPNMRRMLYTKQSQKYDVSDPYEPEPVYEAAIQSTGVSPTTGGTFFFSTNNESIKSINSDISIPADVKKIKNDIKIGGGYQQRVREFDARFLGFTRYQIPISGPVFDKSLLTLPEDRIFAPENMGILANGKGGFKLEEASKLNDSYQASSELTAAFAMIDTRVNEKIRLVWGARYENFTQRLNSFEDDGKAVVVNTNKKDFLPSANIIVAITEKQNIRASYYSTLSRPEFRELAPFGFYDFVTNFSIRGNQFLERATIKNYDLRYELYPGRGQLFSVSGFYKDFTNPIEQINRSDESRALTYKNVSKATNYGVELEFRLIVGSVLKLDSNKLLNNITLFSNLALIKSFVDLSNVVGAIAPERPLQGQSPYVFNAGLQYIDVEKGYGFSFALNRVGRRISIVGNSQEPDIWEQGRTVIDVQLSKTFLKKRNLELKINMKDALAQKLYLYQDLNTNRKLDINSDNIMSETNYGQTYGFSIGYKF